MARVFFMPVPQEHSITLQNRVPPLALQKKQQLLLAKMRKALYEEKYQDYIEYLHTLGRFYQEAWTGKSKNERNKFRQYIQTRITLYSDDKPQTLTALCKNAMNLEAIVIAWEDPALSRSEEKVAEEEAPKAVRYRLKLKESIGKSDRHTIHLGLFAAVADIVDALEKTKAVHQNVIQEINEVLHEVVSGENKLDNIKLIGILKRIKSLNTKEKSALIVSIEAKQYNEKFLKHLEKREKFNKELLQEIFIKIDENKQHSKALLKRPLDLNDEDQKGNEALLETMLFRINSSKKRNVKLLQEFSQQGVTHNKALLQRITNRIHKLEKSNEALLKKITDKVVKNIKDYEKLLKKINYRIDKNKKREAALLNKIVVAEGAENEVGNEALLQKEGYQKLLVENRKHTKELEQLRSRIANSQYDSQELLKKIHSISENKKRIQKLLKKNCGVQEYEFEPWIPTDESTKKNQQIALELKALIKFKKVKKAITSFKTTGSKVLSGVGFFIALIAGLACGVTTGGLILLLLTGFGVPLIAAALIASAVAIAGFYANFRFFSKTISEFLLKLGRVSGYIDENGKRLPLSGVKKILLLFIAFPFSVCVSLSVGAFTYTTVIGLLAGLAVIWPPLPILLAGILTAGIGLATCVVMFSAFARASQKPFSFVQLGKVFSKAWRELTWKRGVGYVIKAAVIIFALVGLGFLSFTGAGTLTGLIGGIAAKCICAASLIGQIPFTIQTVSNFCGLAWNKLTGKDTSASTNESLLSRVREYLGLALNALGNAALVFKLTIQGCVSGAACFLNSLAGNLINGDDKELVIRKRADYSMIQELLSVPASIIKPSANDAVYRAPALGRSPTPPIPIPKKKNTGQQSSAWEARHNVARNPLPFVHGRMFSTSRNLPSSGSRAPQTEEKPCERRRP